MTTVTIRYHGGTSEIRGVRAESVELPEDAKCVEDVSSYIVRVTPRLASVLPRCRFARNGEFADLTEALASGDEIDVLPPVAGGDESWVKLVALRETKLSIDECHDAVSHASAGGIVIFCGAVRDHASGKSVVRLEYEAHGTLAERELRRVLEGVAAEHPGVRLAVTHRTGALAIGDLAIVLAASAAHRAEAFSACRVALDRLKETVPIWKKEWTTDGGAHWVNFGSG